MGDRILGAVCLVIAAAMGWGARSYTAEFSYEPVGPRAFPELLAALLALGGAWLLVRGAKRKANGGPTLAATHALDVRAVAWCAGATLAYGALFQTLGFVLATALMALPVGRAFGGSWRQVALGGAGLGVSLYLLFDKVFDVILPTGVLAFVLGGR